MPTVDTVTDGGTVMLESTQYIDSPHARLNPVTEYYDVGSRTTVDHEQSPIVDVIDRDIVTALS
jgi:hypothetical protein